MIHLTLIHYIGEHADIVLVDEAIYVPNALHIPTIK